MSISSGNLTKKKSIEDTFRSVESLIENNVDRAQILEDFKRLKQLIDEIEDEEQLHGHFKYAYYSKLSCFYASIGSSDEARKNLETSKRFERYFKAPQIEQQASASEDIPNKNSNQKDIVASTKRMKEQLEDFIKSAFELRVDSEQYFQKEHLELLKCNIEHMIELRPANFDEYLYLISMKSRLESLFDEMDVGLANIAANSENAQILLSESVLTKELLFRDTLIEIRLDFIRRVLGSSNPIGLLYNVELIEYSINKRFRDLSLHFHPDKINDWLPNTSENTQLANEFFSIISDTKDKLLKDFTKHGLNDHLISANNLWTISKDFKRLLNGQVNKLEILNRDDFLNFEKDELRKKWTESLSSAHCHYKAACKLADNQKLIQDQVKIRGYIALVLYELGKDMFVSQLYALSALRLVVKHSNVLTEKDLCDAKKIYDKVSKSLLQKNNEDQQVSKSNSLVPKDNSLSLIKLDDYSIAISNAKVSEKISFENRQKIDNTICDLLNEEVLNLVVKSDRQLVRYQASEEEILRAKKAGRTHKVAGYALFGYVGIQAVTFGFFAATGPIAFLGLGILFIGTDIFSNKLIQRGNKILEEPKIRENLNDILKKALEMFDNKKHNEFLEELSKEYTNDKRLISLESLNNSINPKFIISELLMHGFRPDGIAYLLNVIGEVLVGGRISLKEFSLDDQKALALRLFDASLEESLVTEAKCLDKRVQDLRMNNTYLKNISMWKSSFLDFLIRRDYTSIAREHVEDSKTMTFHCRLEELRNIARLNKVIVRLIKNKEDEIKLAEEEIRLVRLSVNKNYQFVGKAALRLDSIEDFFWVITGKSIDQQMVIKTDQLKKLTETEPSLNYLNEKLKLAKSDAEKVEILIKKANYYEKKAKELDKDSNKIECLKEWKEAMNHFDEALIIEKHNVIAAIGHARCLTKLSKYSKAVEYLNNNHVFLSNLSEFWLLMSIANQKINNYDGAKHAITQALANSQFQCDAQILKQNRVIDRLLQKKTKISPTLKCEKVWYNKRTKAELSDYNILSIDGGGVRGIIPAMWLCEIEEKCKRPISHLFNMMAGTSAGAIIASTLAMPQSTTEIHDTENFAVPITTFSKFKPQYSAFKVVELFRLKSRQIFTTNDRKIGFLDNILGTNWSTDKYTDAGRRNLFEAYLNSCTLNDSLNNLVITAVSQNDMSKTYLFNSHDAKIDSHRNESLFNAVMASTAAPTFFPVHQINNKGSFIDGGVHLNNPTMAAYTEALNYGINKENIFVLSLGTGNHILDPYEPDLCRGQLFWAKNFHNVALAAQECNVDKDVYHLLGSRYMRCQIYLDKPVALDDCDSLDNLAELATQYIEELYESDNNEMNKLIEHLLKEN